MPYTRDDVVRSVAERLGLAGDGQSLSLSDDATIRDNLDGIVAELIARGVVDYVDLDAPEDGLFPHLCAIFANEVADQFGVDDAMAARLAGRALVGERRIREIMSLPYSGATQAALYY